MAEEAPDSSCAPGLEPPGIAGAPGVEPPGAAGAPGEEAADPAWETFNGVDAYGDQVSGLSPIEALLRCSPPCSIEELLDEESLAQEFRCGNAELAERLCTFESLQTLVRYVTREPPEEAPEASRYHRPYAASELLASGGDRLREVLARPSERGELLAEFWAFLDTPEVGLAAPSLAGYFCSAAVAFLAMLPLEVSAFLRSLGPEQLLEKLLGLLELRCVAELTALLLAAEAPAHVVFPPGGLVRQLVARLGGTGPVQEHAAFLLEHLLAKACAGDLCYGGELLQQLAEPELVGTLVAQVLAGSDAAAAVLCSAVSNLHLLPAHPLLPVRSPELRAPCTPRSPGPRAAPPSRPEAPLGDRDPDIDADAGVEDEPQEPSGPAAPAEEAAEDAYSLAGPEQRSVAGMAVVAQLCAQLPRLCQALESAASQRASSSSPARPDRAGAEALREAIVLLLKASGDDAAHDTEPLIARLGELSDKPEAQELRDSLRRHGWPEAGPAAPPRVCDVPEVLADLRRAAQSARANSSQAPPPISAGVVVEILCLLTLLAKTGRDTVFEAMLAAEALPRCLEVLLASASSSMLHNAVRAVFTEVIGDRERGGPSVLALLRAAPLMQRVVAEQRLPVEQEPGGRLAHDGCSRSQIGYVGPLRCICADLSDFSRDAPEVAAALEDIDGWFDTVLQGIRAAEEMHQEPLGGVHPEASAGSAAMVNFDCMVAIHGAMAEQGDEIDLSLEDFRDINEDLDLEATLNRSSRIAPCGDAGEDFSMEPMLNMASRQISDLVEMRRRAKAGAEAPDTPFVEEAAYGQPTSEGQEASAALAPIAVDAQAQNADVEWV